MDTQKVNGQGAADENMRRGPEVASVREPAVDGGVANVREEERVQGAREVEEPSVAARPDKRLLGQGLQSPADYPDGLQKADGGAVRFQAHGT